MELIFQCQTELLKLVIDRKDKKLKVSSRATNYQLKDMKWWFLFDKGKERVQDLITSRLSDDDFIKTIVQQMQLLGYSLKSSIK